MALLTPRMGPDDPHIISEMHWLQCVNALREIAGRPNSFMMRVNNSAGWEMIMNALKVRFQHTA
jgi:hypothetical protein